MKAIITAAGMGNRMGKATEKNNKCLLKVHGKMLLEISVDILRRHGISEILVVTGYCYGKVEKALNGKATFVYNPFYEVSGILASIWLGGKYIGNEGFVFITGDSLYHPDILKDCIEKKGDIVVCVEKKKCDKEDYKVIVENNKIVEMGKNIEMERATGEFIGLAKIEKKASKLVFDKVEQFLKRGKLNAYMGDVLMELRKEKLPLTIVYTNPHPRIEIDYPEDLMKAKGIFKNSIKTLLYG
jgi:choline kinase